MRSQAFGRYQLLQRISMGGMAEVSRAIHTPSGMQVAPEQGTLLTLGVPTADADRGLKLMALLKRTLRVDW